ncbi:DUF2294 domain-containing protein [Pirellulaceae bacterium SH449]
MHTETSSESPPFSRLAPARNGTIRPDQLTQKLLEKTQGEIEAEVCEIARRFSLEYTGRGPKDVRVHLVDELLVIRMSGVLTVAEQRLASTSSDIDKNVLRQFRRQLVEIAKNELYAMVGSCTVVNVVSLHHDLCTITGDEILVFTLDEPPITRPIKRR